MEMHQGSGSMSQNHAQTGANIIVTSNGEVCCERGRFVLTNSNNFRL
jgi:hypothetical protein